MKRKAEWQDIEEYAKFVRQVSRGAVSVQIMGRWFFGRGFCVLRIEPARTPPTATKKDE